MKWSDGVPVPTHVLPRRRLEATGDAAVLAGIVVIAEMLLEPVIVVAVEDLTTP